MHHSSANRSLVRQAELIASSIALQIYSTSA